MRILKKILLSTLLVASLGTTLFASSSEENFTFEDGEIICDCGYTFAEHDEFKAQQNPSARYQPCICGGREQSEVVYVDSKWSYTGTSKKCTHYQFGYDFEQTKGTRIRYWCNSCGRESFSNGYITQWECQGFNS